MPDTPFRTVLLRVAVALLAFLRAGWLAGHRSATAVWNEQARPLTALLIDLDSLAVPVADIEPTVRAVVAAAGPCRWTVAAGHPVMSAQAQRVCLALGITVLRTRGRRNSADTALLSAAAELRRAGARRAVVCSHDGDLAAVRLPYTLVVTGRAQPSRLLVQRADAVLKIATG